mmetsp:Transcript_30036/g.35685  ORF Transcript_30036/g.35685 Transcript_30036/m.35685 type:complete len:171 (+) Transcript_30036:37-549(+)
MAKQLIVTFLILALCLAKEGLAISNKNVRGAIDHTTSILNSDDRQHSPIYTKKSKIENRNRRNLLDPDTGDESGNSSGSSSTQTSGSSSTSSTSATSGSNSSGQGGSTNGAGNGTGTGTGINRTQWGWAAAIGLAGLVLVVTVATIMLSRATRIEEDTLDNSPTTDFISA